MLVTGNGGPSGTGKRCAEPVLPPPVFVAEVEPPPRVRGTSAEEMRSSMRSSNLERVESKDAPISAPPVAPTTPVSISDMSNVDSTKSAVATAPATVPTATKNSDNSVSVSAKPPVPVPKEAGAPPVAAPAEPNVISSPAGVSAKDASSPAPEPVVVPLEMPKPGPLAFNGMGSCAVFPVPVSSFSVTIWSRILRSDRTDLLNNPYAGISVSITDLFELTLPPVDAIVLSPWPRPPAYYAQSAPPKIQQTTLPPVAPAGPQNGTMPKIAMLQQLFPSVNISNSNAKAKK